MDTRGPSATTWDPERYSRTARYVADLATQVVELLAPQPGERILDLGCGGGALTETLVRAGCHVVAVDSSEEQVAAALRRGIDARVMDGEDLRFDREFDAVFSNCALHWMRRPDRVIADVWRALRFGGRFVAELGGAGCIQSIVGAIYGALARRGIDGSRLNPWYFPAPEDYAGRLAAGGFRLESMTLVSRPTRLTGDIREWLQTFAQSFTSALPPAERAAFLAEVKDEIRVKLGTADGGWVADYRLLRFAATKPQPRCAPDT